MEGQGQLDLVGGGEGEGGVGREVEGRALRCELSQGDDEGLVEGAAAARVDKALRPPATAAVPCRHYMLGRGGPGGVGCGEDGVVVVEDDVGDGVADGTAGVGGRELGGAEVQHGRGCQSQNTGHMLRFRSVKSNKLTLGHNHNAEEQMGLTIHYWYFASNLCGSKV